MRKSRIVATIAFVLGLSFPSWAEAAGYITPCLPASVSLGDQMRNPTS